MPRGNRLTSSAITLAAGMIGWSITGCISHSAQSCGRTSAVQSNGKPDAARQPEVVEPTAFEQPALADNRIREYPGLHNVVAYGRQLWSGSAPDDSAGFASLRALGVRTIISVDGATPDVALAAVYGLDYVHLPIGYNGMSADRTLKIARAIRDLPGPIYVHCHHGKHRSAAAAAAAAVTLDMLSPDEAVGRMRVSGTSPAYPGLFRCVCDARPASQADLEAADGTFPPLSQPTTFVDAMIQIDDAMSHLAQVEAADWTVPPDHPDLVPASEAGRIVDLFRHLKVAADCDARPADFRTEMQHAEAAAQRLEDELGRSSPTHVALKAAAVELRAECTACHVKYRDW